MTNTTIYVSIDDSEVERLIISFLSQTQWRVDTISAYKVTFSKALFDRRGGVILVVDELSLKTLISSPIFLDGVKIVVLSDSKDLEEKQLKYKKYGVESVIAYPPDLMQLTDQLNALESSLTKLNQVSISEELIDKRHVESPLSTISNTELPNYLKLVDSSNATPIYGKSLAIQQLRDFIEHLAKSVSTVFITGEYGTEIDKVATWIHKKSKFRSHEMVNLCCIGLDQKKLDDFFSSLKHALQKQQRSNSFVYGSIHISNLQELREEEQHIFYRNYLGLILPNLRANSQETTGFRLIVSARDTLTDLVKKGKFRQDLFDGLNCIPIEIPSLKNRTEDIPYLANLYLQQFMDANPHYMGKSFAPNAITYLQSLTWPGNDAELKRKVERICSIVQHPLIMPDDIKLYIKNSVHTGQIQNMFEKYDDFQSFKDASERLFLAHFLDKYAWNVSKTADAIKIQRSHLYSKIKKYNIVRD